MAGGAGNIGSAGGMGNASAQPQGGPFGGGMGGGQQSGGGVPSFAQPYMNNLGGGMGGGQQSSGFGPGVNNFGSGYGGSPFGMQQQQPMQNPFGGQQLGPNQSPGYGAAEFQQQQRGVLGQGGQQMGQQQGPIQSFEQWRAQPRTQDQAFRTPEQQLQQDQQTYQNYKNSFGQQQGQQTPGPFDQQAAQAFMRHQQMGQQQMPQPMPQPMGQRPAYMDNPDFQAYQRQEQDLGRQMNEYMQRAPMYQQLQDLQGKLRGFQQPQQGQMGDTGFRAMPAVMPPQTTQDDAMRTALGHPPLSSSKMGMPDYGSENVAPEFGNFGERRMGGGFGRRGMGGGYGRQMPQQAMGLQGLYSMLQGRRGGPFGGY